TDRSPYVVKNALHGQAGGASGPISLEVPWRHGTKVRSATRADLLRLMIPITKMPDVEWLDANLSVGEVLPQEGGARLPWHLNVHAYVAPQSGYETVIAAHRCRIWMEIEHEIPRTDFQSPSFGPDRNMHIGYGGITVSTPMMVDISATALTVAGC